MDALRKADDMPDVCRQCPPEEVSIYYPYGHAEEPKGGFKAYYHCGEHAWSCYWSKWICEDSATSLQLPVHSPRTAKPRVKSSPASAGFVYIAECGGRYKIGYSKEPVKRIAGLQTGNPELVKLVGTIPGTPAREDELHRAFRAKHIRGEWFSLTESDVQAILAVD